jgi:uncharacterized repeat protein (TIGR03803 family)
MKKVYKLSFISRAIAVASVAVALATTTWAQTEAILHSFAGGSTDGSYPVGGLIFDSKGNLYDTTYGGVGSCEVNLGCGVAFELVAGPNGTWTENVLYTFDLSGGGTLNPSGPLTFDSQGNLYGMSENGGSQLLGTVFELSPGSGGWTEKVLHEFQGGTDGSSPFGFGVVLDSAGNLYAAIDTGGAYGFGQVFELVPGTSGTWSKKVLYSFKYLNDGAYPNGTLIFDKAGNLYGVASYGGTHDYGVVYELTPGSSGKWTEKVLYSFPGGAGGAYPSGNLVFDSAGKLYGATAYTVFELIPGSSGTWTQKTLHTFAGGSDGADLRAGMIFDKASNLYGTTEAGGTHRGTVFELTPGSSGIWTEKILHRFSASGGDGILPLAPLTIDANGNLYGTTYRGGADGYGVVFEITP